MELRFQDAGDEELDEDDDGDSDSALDSVEDMDLDLDSDVERVLGETETDLIEETTLVEVTEEVTPEPVDLTKFSDLIQTLESSSGHKLVKAVVKNLKGFCSLGVQSPGTVAEVTKTVDIFCGECLSNEKKEGKLLKSVGEFSCEGDLFKTVLKAGMRNARNGEAGHDLISILRGLYSVAGPGGRILNPVLGIQMILSHSRAEEIFLEKPAKTSVPFHPPKHLEDDPRKARFPSEPPPQPQQFSKIKTELLRLWLVLVEGFCTTSKEIGTEGDKKIMENSVPYLMQMYGGTLGRGDRQIFSILKLYSSKKLRLPLESTPLFGPKCFEPQPAKANPLYAHSIRANAVLGLINDVQAFETGMNWQENLVDEEEDLEKFYDLRFLLPLVCHVLDEKNICDSVKVMTNGWIYLIMRGLALDDLTLRKAALLAYKRLLFNLQLAKGFRLQDVKIWLHFLLGIKAGLSCLEELKLSTLVSIWAVSTCEVLKQPTHPMYSKVTNFLLAKPILDLTILPDFIPFFNAVDGNKESRDWILKIMLLGLRKKEDWQLARKVPTVKFLCSSFLLEKIGNQRLILKILANGASIPEVALDMVDRHSLLIWIANINLEGDKYYRRELEDIYKNLAVATPKGPCREAQFKYLGMKHGWPLTRE